MQTTSARQELPIVDNQQGSKGYLWSSAGNYYACIQGNLIWMATPLGGHLSPTTQNFVSDQLLPPATKLRQGNVFTPVCHSVPGGGCLPHNLGRHPPAQCMLGYIPMPCASWDMVNKQVVRILLECILVIYYICQCIGPSPLFLQQSFFDRMLIARRKFHFTHNTTVGL